jgi:predicted TIM-barrel fold metal-dependent hydrolase
MIVDGHAHVWTLDTATYPWQPTFGFVPTEEASPADLLTVMDRHAVGHALLVQPSAYGRDHRFLLDTVRTHADRFLAIGLVDPSYLDDPADAVALVRDGRCVGLRVNLSLDLELAAAQATGPGWAAIEELGAPVCIRATPAHHDLVTGILGRHRSLPLVVDHLGLPGLDRLAEAAERLAELARYEQCLLKVAGLARLSRSSPPYQEIWPVVRAALRSFGSSRLLWGSDFPATDGADGYAASIEAIESMPFVTSTDRDRLMWETSRALWGVPTGTTPS